MDYKTLLVSTEDRVTTIRLNRPETLNALNAALLAELAEAIGVADADPAVGAIVVTGSEKAFAAGADIREMSGRTFVDTFGEDMFTASSDEILRCRKPIIAAVAGYCLGGGCELAMLCDFILAADTAKFGQPEVNLGVIPGLGGTQRLPRLVGQSKAMEMVLTGRLIGAEEAERSGLVSRVVPADELLAEAGAVARTIASKPPLAIKAAKEAVARATESSLREGLIFERRMFQALFSTADQKEGMAAFLEKREPRFEGR